LSSTLDIRKLENKYTKVDVLPKRYVEHPYMETIPLKEVKEIKA
jgi:hypothetical protein